MPSRPFSPGPSTRIGYDVRTSDDTATLTKLADLGHEHQERRARTLAWVAGENQALYEVFKANVRQLDAAVGPLVAEAWQLPPITQADAMVLSGWGPGRLAAEAVERLNCAVSCRARWRRWSWLVPGLPRRRLRRMHPPPAPPSAAPQVPAQVPGPPSQVSQPAEVQNTSGR